MISYFYLFIFSHKEELQGLQNTDPEFFKYLQKNDTNLLEFGGDDEDDSEGDDSMNEDEMYDEGSDVASDDGDDSESEEEGDYMEGSSKNRKQDRQRLEITIEMVDTTVEKALKNDSLTELKKLLSMFRTACIPNGETDLNDNNRDDGNSVSRYIIPSGEIYEKVMMSCIDNIYIAFNKYLGKDLTEANRIELSTLDKNPKWKKLQLLIVSYFKSIMHTLNGLAQSTKQSNVALFLINSLENYIPFLSPLPRLTKNVIKILLDLWAQQPNIAIEGNEKNDHINVRSYSFLRIRQIAKQLPGAIAEECFRSMYLKFARQCKTYNELTAPTVVFMIQSVTELYGTDIALAYQQAFLYVRQLALHLRAALLKKSEETTRQITSMQYLNCIRLWTKVISTYSSTEEGLGALAFPLSQVIFGVISAVTSIYYTPLKFNLITCLHQIAASCEVLIPTTAIVFEVMEHPDLVAKPVASTELAPKLDQLVKFPTNAVLKAIVRDTIIQEAVQLLRQDIEIYRYHVGLPEYSYLTIRKLKAYLKKCKITKWRDMIRNVVGQMEQYSTLAQSGRKALNCGPMSITTFEPLLPSGGMVVKQRIAKLIAGGRGTVLDGAAVSIVNKVVTTEEKSSKTHKDLFSSSYSAIKAGQAKAAKAAKAAKRKSSEDSEGEGSEGSDNEDADSFVGSDEDEELEGSEDDDDSVMEFDGSEGSEGEDFDSEEEVVASSSKNNKAQGKKAATTTSTVAVKKNTNRKRKKAAIGNYGDVDPNSLEDDVGALDWDNED